MAELLELLCSNREYIYSVLYYIILLLYILLYYIILTWKKLNSLGSGFSVSSE